jgi:hypothetical protein
MNAKKLKKLRQDMRKIGLDFRENKAVYKKMKRAMKLGKLV